MLTTTQQGSLLLLIGQIKGIPNHQLQLKRSIHPLPRANQTTYVI